MKSIIISSNSSGGGKTTITLGIMKALIKRGFSIQGYKVGPDYIDPAFHRHITRKPSRNLDMFLMGKDGVKASYSRGKGDYGVIEGVMGLYDGKGITSEYSTAEVAKLLDLPVVLVLSPKAQSVTICAEINGLVNFDKIKIAGIIFNNVKDSYYKLLKAAVEKNCTVPVLGYVPKDDFLAVNSRHLGLVQSEEIVNLEDKIEYCSELLEKYVDMDKLMESFKATEAFEDKFHIEKKGIKVAVAYDKAFKFYYEENLELLREIGEVVTFSPLKDKTLPEDIDFLYLGGGYPEVFINELSANISMIDSIKRALDSGLRCYAECGGLMYLTETIKGNNTVGFLSGHAMMTKSLQNFGYAEIEIVSENRILPKGLKINCHEFHMSKVDSQEETIYKVTKTMYDGNLKSWNCGYIKNNTLGAYGHIHFFGNLEFFKYAIDLQ